MYWYILRFSFFNTHIHLTLLGFRTCHFGLSGYKNNVGHPWPVMAVKMKYENLNADLKFLLTWNCVIKIVIFMN